MSYTKGPWHDDGENIWASIVRTGDDGHQYRTSAIVAKVRDSGKLSEEEKDANAKLILIAPDLLEALINLHQNSVNIVEMNGGIHFRENCPTCALIANAEGRTQ